MVFYHRTSFRYVHIDSIPNISNYSLRHFIPKSFLNKLDDHLDFWEENKSSIIFFVQKPSKTHMVYMDYSRGQLVNKQIKIRI